VQRTDQYQRTLAYVYVGDVMLNAELVRRGHAQMATFPPNVEYQELLILLAKSFLRGLASLQTRVVSGH
jgi:micrococcal nuclease